MIGLGFDNDSAPYYANDQRAREISSASLPEPTAPKARDTESPPPSTPGQAVRHVLLRGLGTPDIVIDGALPSSTMDLACAVAAEVAG